MGKQKKGRLVGFPKGKKGKQKSVRDFLTFLGNKKGKKKMESIFWAIFPKGKKGKQKSVRDFLTFLGNKKGMEMWQIVLMLLSLVLLVFLIAWYASLNSDLGLLGGKLEELF
jgi:hypothetical protein